MCSWGRRPPHGVPPRTGADVARGGVWRGRRRSPASTERTELLLLDAFIGLLSYGSPGVRATGTTNLYTIAFGRRRNGGRGMRRSASRCCWWAGWCRRAVPRAGAGRVRRRADPDHGIHSSGRQGRGVWRSCGWRWSRSATPPPPGRRRCGGWPCSRWRSGTWWRRSGGQAVLACGSIAHADYLLVAVAAATPGARRSSRCPTQPPWAPLPSAAGTGQRGLAVDDLDGWRTAPLGRVRLAVFVLSLLGFPEPPGSSANGDPHLGSRGGADTVGVAPARSVVSAGTTCPS
jgi:hypothetical protein